MEPHTKRRSPAAANVSPRAANQRARFIAMGRQRAVARRAFVSLTCVELERLRQRAMAELARIGTPEKGTPNRRALRRQCLELRRDLEAIEQAYRVVPRPGTNPPPAALATTSPYCDTALVESWREN